VRVSVITISDRASRGEYEDRSGAEIECLLREKFPEAEMSRDIVPDEPESITAAFRKNSDADYILTTGGTGISLRDRTPEVTESYCDRAIPGIAERLRAESYSETPFSILSRGYAGIKDRTIIVNFPGSLKAVRLCVRILLPVMEHGLRMIRGEGHGDG